MEQEQENENNSGIFGKPMKYKEICRIFDDEEFTRGNQRENQLKRWNKNFEIIKEKTYYTILRERTSEEKQNKEFICYKNKNHHIRNQEKYKQFDVAEINRHSSGIYKIQLDNNIYIGQTNDFYNRFRHHYYSNFPTHDLLENGAIFSIVELENDKEKRLQKEKEYIIKYSNDNNYICINNNFNKKKYYNDKFILKFNQIDKDKIIKLLKKEGVTYYR